MRRVLRKRVGGGLLTAGTIALVFACGDALQQDELDCEEAVSHLGDCCPGFDTRAFRCIDDGCGGHNPDISEQDSVCIRAESCQELVRSGVCPRAQQELPGSNGASTAQVCP